MVLQRSIDRRAKYHADPAFRENLLRISREYRARDPERTAAQTRRDKLRSRYGIGVALYDEMLAAQGGVCAICGLAEQIEGRLLAVDHERSTGRVRGLLCNRCNRGIGFLGDEPDRLAAAAEYVRTR